MDNYIKYETASLAHWPLINVNISENACLLHKVKEICPGQNRALTLRYVMHSDEYVDYLECLDRQRMRL